MCSGSSSQRTNSEEVEGGWAGDAAASQGTITQTREEGWMAVNKWGNTHGIQWEECTGKKRICTKLCLLKAQGSWRRLRKDYCLACRKRSGNRPRWERLGGNVASETSRRWSLRKLPIPRPSKAARDSCPTGRVRATRGLPRTGPVLAACSVFQPSSFPSSDGIRHFFQTILKGCDDGHSCPFPDANGYNSSVAPLSVVALFSLVKRYLSVPIYHILFY